MAAPGVPYRRGMRRRSRSLGTRIASVVVLCLVAYIGVTAVQVWATSRRDERGPAEAIIVLGAAQYDGAPSPVFRARLDHALELWRAGVAPIVSVTGGGRPGDRSTEARAAAEYLLARGMSDEDILREVDARNTWESLAATARFLRPRGLDRVVLVSDPSHMHRIATIAEDVGLDADVSPTRTSPTVGLAALRQGARETVAVAAGRLVGHRRLTNLDRLLGTMMR